jgi:hypothetical protein
MQPTDPFPIERCSPRLRAAILAEFDGRSPTFQDILSISPKRWLTVPGMGATLLKELESILQNPPAVAQGELAANPNDPDLLARLERLQGDLEKLRDDVQVLLGDVPSGKANTNGSDVH